MRWIIAGLVSILGTMTVLAQQPPQCAAVLNAALSSLVTECAEQPLGSACYGNSPVSVVFAGDSDARTDDDEAEAFRNPGDTVALADVETLATGAADTAQGAWGLARLTPRLNYTEGAVTMLLLGDTTVTNTGDPAADVPAPLIPVTFPEGANIRAEPIAIAEQTGIVFVGDSVRATGILADGSWVRVIDEEGTIGWMTATAFTATDLTPLATVAASDGIAYGTMQAFTLQTGTDDDPCAVLPPSGVLLQTPTDAESARLLANDVPLLLSSGSTVFLSASADDVVDVAVLEGEAQVGDAFIVPVRNAITLPADADTEVMPYDYAALATLPVDRLPRPIFVPLDFDTLLRPPPPDGTSPLADVALESDCTIAARNAPANLREQPNPSGRVRHVMQIGQSALPDARAQGTDGVLWWRLAPDVWVSSNAVVAAGGCGRLPLLVR